jgi:hypothetical protein
MHRADLRVFRTGSTAHHQLTTRALWQGKIGASHAAGPAAEVRPRDQIDRTHPPPGPEKPAWSAPRAFLLAKSLARTWGDTVNVEVSGPVVAQHL